MVRGKRNLASYISLLVFGLLVLFVAGAAPLLAQNLSIRFVAPRGDTVSKADAPIKIRGVVVGGRAVAGVQVNTTNGTILNQMQTGNVFTADWFPDSTGQALLSATSTQAVPVQKVLTVTP